MAKLWDYYDGEPFLENPHLGLLLLNRAKKGKKRMAVRRRKNASRRGRKATARRRATNPRRRRSRARRNPYPMAGVVINPRRRRGRRRLSNPRRRRGFARRNPSLFGVSLPPLNKVLFAGVGFIAPPMIEGFANQFLPASITTSTIGKYAIKVASVIALTLGVRRFVGREEGNMVAVGGGVYLAASAINEFAPGIIPLPSFGVGMYVPARQTLREYRPATNVTSMPIGSGMMTNSVPKYGNRR